MPEVIASLIPNVLDRVPELVKSFQQTLYLIAFSGAISFVIGMVLGVVLTVTKPGNILENKLVYTTLDRVINLSRSIPFIILIGALIPLTRAVVGTAIGTKGAILPLIFGTVPFFARQIETALAQMDKGLIEAAQAMGSSPWEIIFRVYLKELFLSPPVPENPLKIPPLGRVAKPSSRSALSGRTASSGSQ